MSGTDASDGDGVDVLRHYTDPDAKYKSGDWLYQKYVVEDLTTTEMGEACGVYAGTITHWMDKFGIDRDGNVEAQISGDTRYTSEEWLREQYHDEGLSQPEIADKCGVAQCTVSFWMREYDIDRRGRRERSLHHHGHRRYHDKEWLEEKYWDEGLSTCEIAEICGVEQTLIHSWFKRHGIDCRSLSEGVQKAWDEGKMRDRALSGVDIENIGPGDIDIPSGRDFRKTSEWYALRRMVKRRDGEVCQWCWDEGQELHAHHIVPVGRGGPKFDPNNLITLCESCHMDAHHGNEVFFA